MLCLWVFVSDWAVRMVVRDVLMVSFPDDVQKSKYLERHLGELHITFDPAHMRRAGSTDRRLLCEQ